jgi:peroxiredoxin Q/BCP
MTHSQGGDDYMGIARMSYLIDPKGRVAKVCPKVKPEGHAAEVLGDLMELMR